MTADFHEAWRTATPAPPRRPIAPADTPPGAEERLESYRDALDKAAEMLTAARNAELEAEEARDAAKREAQLSDEYPDMRAPGWNAARVKAWVEDRIAEKESAYRAAKVARQAASDHLQKVKEQGRFQQSLTASVRESYRGTGRYAP